jgi:phosphoribosylglycinamide formyltransferase 1
VIRLGVLVSGGGTNLQAILDAIANKTLDAEVALVISNDPAAGALERARRAGVPVAVIDHKAFPDRPSFETALVTALRARGVEWIVLAGFMRLLTRTFLDAFPWRVVNVHPALLPAFPGTHGPRQAVEYGVKIAGCTVHLVDAGTDTGPVIAQASVPVLDDDDADTLAARILVAEHALLPRVLQWIAEGRVTVEDATGERKRARVRVALST